MPGCEAAQWCASAGCLPQRRKPWMTVPVHSHAHLCWRPARARCALPSGQPWNGLRSASAFLPTQPTLSTEGAQELGCLCGKAAEAALPQATVTMIKRGALWVPRLLDLGLVWPIAHERRSQPGQVVRLAGNTVSETGLEDSTGTTCPFLVSH